MIVRSSLPAACGLTVLLAGFASAQTMSPAATGTVEKITVHGS